MLSKIKEILENHVGKNNSITSAEIARSLNIQEDDTHAETRNLLFQTAKEYELPLAASNKGYYLIDSEDEYKEYMDSLNGRIAGIEERKDIITKNYKGKK